ncbi:Phosphatidylinositolglycan class N-domain-containing protein [Mycena leptocephala]|nr:Phosphatidylinositolglycan class N-domain-containing protein [Mycena leptocephala]
MYEDPSPRHIFLMKHSPLTLNLKGWKTNPYRFLLRIAGHLTHVLRRSHTRESPDMVIRRRRGKFTQGITTFASHSLPDFLLDATALDAWVFDHLESLLQNATTNSTLDSQLRSPGTIVFLHLLGLDTTGHSYRPHTQEYMKSIQVVDSIVHRTEHLIEQFYQDEDTSYIFTADHGMSTIGNHGDGHSSPTSHDAYSEPWEVNHLLRRDIEQADVAPLMATLLGLNWPANSVGILPDVDPTKPGYLLPDQGDETLAKAAQINAKVITEQYRIKHGELFVSIPPENAYFRLELRMASMVLYRPFGRLEELGSSNRFKRLDSIKQAISTKQWDVARQLSSDLIKDSLEGLRYLQTYDRTFIKAMAAGAYTGWAAYALLFVVRPLERYSTESSEIAVEVLAVHHVPCYFWHQFIVQVAPLIGTSTLQMSHMDYGRILLYDCIRPSMDLESGFLGIGTLWPLWSSAKERPRPSRFFSPYFWTASCLVTGIFPLLSVNKTESLPAILAGGFCMIGVGTLFAAGNLPKPVFRLFMLQVILIALAMTITSSSVHRLRAKLGLPLLNQVAGWIVRLPSSPSYPAFASKRELKAAHVFPRFRVEGLFYVAYFITLVSWIEVERAFRHDSSRGMKSQGALQYDVLRYTFRPDDMRIALFFLFFAQAAFFGAGNRAERGCPPAPFSLSLVTLALMDGMTLTFFFNVTDTGSWLEIGQRISFFCVNSLLLLWSTGGALGEYLMADVLSSSLRSTK